MSLGYTKRAIRAEQRRLNLARKVLRGEKKLLELKSQIEKTWDLVGTYRDGRGVNSDGSEKEVIEATVTANLAE